MTILPLLLVQAKAEEWMQSTQDTANQARNVTSDAAQSAKESAQHGKDQSAGFIQQVKRFLINC